ncbi:hypothetical protein PRK78_001826 [Emydomyces testavorans]|uniref:Uncharacterized protein n=1 Tax=Emydomyces testavorans TaxID=2070801 RepID=A0AAF0IH19_9EURO|nr:hypothetical protein PRK78_001826 [Emydomyces testavorans]
MQWNHQADARLLVAIIKTGPKLNLKAIAEFMGDDCTEYALQHRIRKLQKLAASKSDASAPATPTKGTPRSKSANSTPGTAGKKRKAAVKEEDETDVKKESPKKKVKREEYDDDSDYYA